MLSDVSFMLGGVPRSAGDFLRQPQRGMMPSELVMQRRIHTGHSMLREKENHLHHGVCSWQLDVMQMGSRTHCLMGKQMWKK